MRTLSLPISGFVDHARRPHVVDGTSCPFWPRPSASVRLSVPLERGEWPTVERRLASSMGAPDSVTLWRSRRRWEAGLLM
jgi:hypothetical protein